MSGQLYFLPRAQIRVVGSVDPAVATGISVTISVSYVADTRYRYYLAPSTNILYDDEYKLYVDANGLLETANVVSDDKTGAILGDIANIGAATAKFAAGLAPTDRKALGALEDLEKPEPFDYAFFLDEVDRIKPMILKRGFALDVQTEPVRGAQFRSLREPSGEKPQKENGVVFRPAIPCRITVTDAPFRARVEKYKAWGVETSYLSKAIAELTSNETRIGELRKTIKTADAKETELMQTVERRKKEPGVDSKDPLLLKYEKELEAVRNDMKDFADKLAAAERRVKDLENRVTAATTPAKEAEEIYRNYYTEHEHKHGLKGHGVEVADGALRGQLVVPVPDENMLLLLKMNRTAFVKRTDNIVFSKGLLTKVEGTKPSPLLGFLQIPKTLLTAIAPLPLELRQTRINNINAQRTLDGLLAPAPPVTTPAQ